MLPVVWGERLVIEFMAAAGDFHATRHVRVRGVVVYEAAKMRRGKRVVGGQERDCWEPLSRGIAGERGRYQWAFPRKLDSSQYIFLW